MAGPWDRYQSGPAPHDTVGDPIIAPPDPYKQAAEGRAQQDQGFEAQRLGLAIRSDQRAEEEAAARRAKDAAEAEDRQRQLQAQETGIEDAKAQIRRVIGAATQAKELSNSWFATGFGAETAKGFGGSSAADVSALLNTIGANTAFDRLQRMREESPTGGALGAVSEIELQLLRDSIASLDQSQSDAQFRSNMDKVIESYQRVLDRLEGRDDPQTDATTNTSVPAATEDRWPGVVGEDGRPLPPSGGYGRDPQTGEWSMYGGTTDDSPPAPQEGRLNVDGFLQGLGQGAGSIVEGAAALPGMLINPVGQAMYDALGYDKRYDTGDILRNALGLPENTNRTSDTIIQGASAALTGGLGARAAGTLFQPGVARNVLNLVGRTPIRDTAAGAGAGAGMIAGEASGIPGADIAGALAGGMIGYGGASAAANVGRGAPNQIMQDANALHISMLPADAGGVGSRMATGAFGRTWGGIPIAEGARNSVASAGRARDRVAAMAGDVSDDTGAGQAVAQGVSRFRETSRTRETQLFDRISVPSDAPMRLDATRSGLEELTQGFRSNPELSRIWAGNPRLRETLEALTPQDVAADGRRAFMEASQDLTNAQQRYDQLRNAVSSPGELAAAGEAVNAARLRVQQAQRQATREPVGGDLSWEDAKRLRSTIGEIIGQPGIASDGSDVAALRKFYGALTSDMEATAAAAGPRALREWRRANQYTRGREARLENVFSTLLGPRGDRAPEKVFQQINAWARREGGDFSRLARTIRSLPPEEAGIVRSTIISRMGMARPRFQEGAGEVFSPQEWASQWHGMSNRAKAVLFPNREHRQALNRLANVMDGMKRANDYQNFSNTALAGNTIAQGALAFTNLPVALGLAAVQFGAGKLLASPAVARVLARAPRTQDPAANRRWLENLGTVAGREGALGAEFDIFRRAVNDNLPQAGNLAASPNEGPQEDQRR